MRDFHRQRFKLAGDFARPQRFEFSLRRGRWLPVQIRGDFPRQDFCRRTLADGGLAGSTGQVLDDRGQFGGARSLSLGKIGVELHARDFPALAGNLVF